MRHSLSFVAHGQYQVPTFDTATIIAQKSIKPAGCLWVNFSKPWVPSDSAPLTTRRVDRPVHAALGRRCQRFRHSGAQISLKPSPTVFQTCHFGCFGDLPWLGRIRVLRLKDSVSPLFILYVSARVSAFPVAAPRIIAPYPRCWVFGNTENRRKSFN